MFARRLLVGRGIDTPLGHDEQSGDGGHRAADQERLVPAALMSEQCRRNGAHDTDRTAAGD